MDLTTCDPSEPVEPSIPISALQHFLYCPRQCAMIHLDRVWEENAHTASGRLLHDRAHAGDDEARPGLYIARGLELASPEWGIHGQADVVEFHSEPDAPPDQLVSLAEREDQFRPVPVEYKRGKPKKNPCDRVQLCAQAICLESMLHVKIPAGVLYYGKTHRRTETPFDEKLRALTRSTIAQVRAMFLDGKTPTAPKTRKCQRCSLRDACLPDRTGRSRPVASQYLQRMLREHLDSHSEGPPDETSR